MVNTSSAFFKTHRVHFEKYFKWTYSEFKLVSTYNVYLHKKIILTSSNRPGPIIGYYNTRWSLTSSEHVVIIGFLIRELEKILYFWQLGNFWNQICSLCSTLYYTGQFSSSDLSSSRYYDGFLLLCVVVHVCHPLTKTNENLSPFSCLTERGLKVDCSGKFSCRYICYLIL